MITLSLQARPPPPPPHYRLLASTVPLRRCPGPMCSRTTGTYARTPPPRDEPTGPPYVLKLRRGASGVVWGAGEARGGRWAKTKRTADSGSGGEGGSSCSNRFGHANATPLSLSEFNQVLNTSIVAHLGYSHHSVLEEARVVLLSSLLSFLFLSVPLRRTSSALIPRSFCRIRLRSYEGPISVLAVAGREKRKGGLKLSPQQATGAPRRPSS